MATEDISFDISFASIIKIELQTLTKSIIKIKLQTLTKLSSVPYSNSHFDSVQTMSNFLDPMIPDYSNEEKLGKAEELLELARGRYETANTKYHQIDENTLPEKYKEVGYLVTELRAWVERLETVVNNLENKVEEDQIDESLESEVESLEELQEGMNEFGLWRMICD